MGIPNLPEIPPNPSTQQLAQIVGALTQELTYLLSGFLSSSNAREFGGWQVSQSKLETKKGVYPRIEFDSKDLAMAAYQTADKYFRVSPDAFGSTPGIEMINATAGALFYLLGNSLRLSTPDYEAEMQISSGKDLDLLCNTTGGYHTRVNSWSAFQNKFNSRTLQDEIDTLTAQGNANMIDINSLFAYCNNLDMRLTALGG